MSEVWTNDAVITALESLGALSKIGSKNKEIVQRLAKMIVWSKAVTQEFFVQRDTLTNTWAEKDEDGDIKIKATDDNKGQIPIMRNGVEYNLAVNELLRGKAKFEGEPPQPFKWDDLEKFQKMPDAVVIAGLGPFAVL